ncbi:hypothetical protein DXG01_015698 [Tephrocybe rancida]|nr:hypothetical protein DXG01_015698 [Tephrocybe rancida]
MAMPTNPDDTKIQRSTEFWFSDGSIILIVQNVAFRVHKSILSKHSEVFSDLFKVPQPRNDAETMDGVAVVNLSDDLKDFKDVLGALYEPLLSRGAELHTIIQFVSGILKVSTKYNIYILRQKCISILRGIFPTSLNDCDMLLSSGYSYNASAIVQAIPLARETNIPEILPWAFYVSSSISEDALLKDSVLSWKDKALCLVGKDQLWSFQKSQTHRFLFEFSKAPACVLACQSRLPQLMTWRRTEELRTKPHPLESFDEWDSLKVCLRCLEHSQILHQKAREKVWDELPSVYHLGSWEDIRTDQNHIAKSDLAHAAASPENLEDVVWATTWRPKLDVQGHHKLVAEYVHFALRMLVHEDILVCASKITRNDSMITLLGRRDHDTNILEAQVEGPDIESEVSAIFADSYESPLSCEFPWLPTTPGSTEPSSSLFTRLLSAHGGYPCDKYVGRMSPPPPVVDTRVLFDLEIEEGAPVFKRQRRTFSNPEPKVTPAPSTRLHLDFDHDTILESCRPPKATQDEMETQKVTLGDRLVPSLPTFDTHTPSTSAANGRTSKALLSSSVSTDPRISHKRKRTTPASPPSSTDTPPMITVLPSRSSGLAAASLKRKRETPSSSHSSEATPPITIPSSPLSSSHSTSSAHKRRRREASSSSGGASITQAISASPSTTILRLSPPSPPPFKGSSPSNVGTDGDYVQPDALMAQAMARSASRRSLRGKALISYVGQELELPAKHPRPKHSKPKPRPTPAPQRKAAAHHCPLTVICTRTFTSVYDCARHTYEVHLKTKRVKCTSCSQEFARSDSLARHTEKGACGVRPRMVHPRHIRNHPPMVQVQIDRVLASDDLMIAAARAYGERERSRQNG